MVDGAVVASDRQDSEAANWVSWDVASLQGQEAHIEILDQNTGGWGHILVDHIMFSAEQATPVSVETSVNLLVDDQVVRTATGPNSEALDWVGWDVRDLAGQSAKIQIIDNNTGGWGHLLVDQFTLADEAARPRPSEPTGWTTGGTSTPASPSTTCQEPADHDRLDEQLAVRRIGSHRSVAQRDECAAGPVTAHRRRQGCSSPTSLCAS